MQQPLTQNPSAPLTLDVQPETSALLQTGTKIISRKKKKSFSLWRALAVLTLVHGYAFLSITTLLAYWWTGLVFGVLAIILIASVLGKAQSPKTRFMLTLIPLLVFCGGFGFLFFLSHSLLIPGTLLWYALSVEWHRSLLSALERGGLLKVKIKPFGLWISAVAAFISIASWYHLRIFLGLSFVWFFSGITITVAAFLSVLAWLVSLDDSTTRVSTLVIALGGIEIALALEFLSLSVFPRSVLIVAFLCLSVMALKHAKQTHTHGWRTVRFPCIAFLGIILLMLLTARWK